MVIGVDCPRAVSDGGRITTGVDDITTSAITGTTISKQRMKKRVRMIGKFRIARGETLQTEGFHVVRRKFWLRRQPSAAETVVASARGNPGHLSKIQVARLT